MNSRIRHPPRKRGPVAPNGGRVRITVNLPMDLLPLLDLMEGRSRSEKVVSVIRLVLEVEGFPHG